MENFDYGARARAVTEAQAEVWSAFNDMADRYDLEDPRTRRWNEGLDAFRNAVVAAYAGSLRSVSGGVRTPADADTSDILDFLEADPVFFRSGYMKERLLRAIKQRELTDGEIMRLQSLILAMVCKPARREFRRYCQAVLRVDSVALRAALERLKESEDAGVRRRATWVLSALERVHLKP